jgi:streptomycin 6-kinase
MNDVASTAIWRRVEDRIRVWRIVLDRFLETESSILAFGQRDGQPVVLKVIRNHGGEWRCGEVLKAFGGNGMVRVLDHLDGAVLLERLRPGSSLTSMVMNGNDDRATGILAEVLGSMSPSKPVHTVPLVEDWAEDFVRLTGAAKGRIPHPLCESARRVYLQLCASQSNPRLLHGDLHHYNVLLDSERGWLAIDPKGVIGEVEYEVGAVLRNPYERPEVFAAQATIEKRVDRFERELHLDAGRMLAWAFGQAVLAAIWAVEDGCAVEVSDGWIALAHAIRPMLAGVVDA